MDGFDTYGSFYASKRNSNALTGQWLGVSSSSATTYEPYHVLSSISSSDGYAYGFIGQMKVNEWAGSGNHNTALFWEYDVRTGWRGYLDPVTYPWQSIYITFDNNLIWKSDILGNTALTDVIKEKDGTYKVQGGKEDGDKNIYVVGKDGKRKGKVVGNSKTPQSILDDKGNAVMGATINPNDNSGENFQYKEVDLHLKEEQPKPPKK